MLSEATLLSVRFKASVMPPHLQIYKTLKPFPLQRFRTSLAMYGQLIIKHFLKKKNTAFFSSGVLHLLEFHKFLRIH